MGVGSLLKVGFVLAALIVWAVIGLVDLVERLQPEERLFIEPAVIENVETPVAE